MMRAPYLSPAERAECFGPWAERDSAAAIGTGYHVEVQRLPLADGGGFVATVPELPGCMSDGETVGEARANASDAIGCWLAAARRRDNSAVTVVSPETFASLLDMLDRPPQPSEELRRLCANRRWR